MFRFLYYALMVLFVVGVTACDDEEQVDFAGDTVSRIFVRETKKTAKIMKTPVGNISAVKYKFPVYSNRKSREEVKVTVVADNSLVESYNAANGVTFHTVPQEAIVFDKEFLTIPVGEMISIDSITVTLNNSLLGQLAEDVSYLIPIRVSEASGGNARPSSNMATFYLPVTIEENNVNADALESDIQGTPVEDRSGWYGSEPYAYAGCAALYNGDHTDTWYVRTRMDLALTFDLGKNYKIGGIHTCLAEKPLTDWTNALVFLSGDGQNWEKMGPLVITKVFTAFYAPIEARYVKITKPSTGFGWSYIYMSEFNIYAE